MSVDPVDDCTFWYTNEYLKTNGSWNWSTWITSFRFPGCVSATPDFTISATPASQTVAPGQVASYTVTAGALNGFADTVSLSVSGLPAGASATFNPASMTGSGTATLQVSTSGGAPSGTSTLTITGTSGSLTHTTTVSLVVAAPDFTLSVSPGSQSIRRGSATSYAVTVGALNGFTGLVVLSASGLPAGATASFTPASVAGSGSSTLRVSTSGSTPTGTYTLKITGTFGSLTHSASVQLRVTKH